MRKAFELSTSVDVGQEEVSKVIELVSHTYPKVRIGSEKHGISNSLEETGVEYVAGTFSCKRYFE